jgi:hypothetical protein
MNGKPQIRMADHQDFENRGLTPNFDHQDFENRGLTPNFEM